MEEHAGWKQSLPNSVRSAPHHSAGVPPLPHTGEGLVVQRQGGVGAVHPHAQAVVPALPLAGLPERVWEGSVSAKQIELRRPRGNTI